MTTFDPVTGKLNVSRADLLSKGVMVRRKRGRSTIKDGKKVTEVLRDDDGTVAGLTTEHSSGRVDGDAFPKAPEADLHVEIGSTT